MKRPAAYDPSAVTREVLISYKARARIENQREAAAKKYERDAFKRLDQTIPYGKLIVQ